MRIAVLAILLASALTPPALARELPVPADKGWQHAQTGLILRATLLGLPRTHLTDTGTAERDVIAQFNDPALATSATVYLFHAAEPSVPIWFDRAEYALMHRAGSSSVTPAGDPRPFAPPHATAFAGLRRTYRPDHGPYKGEGLAVMPLGDWLVAIRLSSDSLDPAGVDTALSSLLAELVWPAAVPAPTGAATPVAVCANRLKTHHAKVKKPDVMQALLGSTMVLAASKEDAKPQANPAGPWCRDGDGSTDFAAYRRGDGSGYLLAIRDAGRSADVYPGLALPNEPGTGGYLVALHDVDGSAAIYPSFDALPEPKQLFDLIAHGSPVSRVDGSNVNINATSLK